MNKFVKVLVFIIVSIVIVVASTLMKGAGAGAVFSIAGIAIVFLYKAMFKNNNNGDDSDITLKK